MKLLILFFSFFLVTINLMAKETLLSGLEKSDLIIENGSSFFCFDILIKVNVCNTYLSSSQIISIGNNHSHVLMHMPHSYLKSYKTGNCSELLYTDIDKYLVSTNWNKNNFNFYFLEESFYYGKAPPDEKELE